MVLASLLLLLWLGIWIFWSPLVKIHLFEQMGRGWCSCSEVTPELQLGVEYTHQT